MIPGKHYWGLTTAPDDTGTRTDYADRTIAQLEKQGLCPCLPEEGGRGTLRVFMDGRRRGQAWNFLRALDVALESGAEKITLLEDDIEITRGFVARVEATPVPADCAFISWFDPFLGCPRLGTYGPYAMLPPKEPLPAAPGFVRRVCALFYCNQALTFTRETASRLARAYLAAQWDRQHEGDVLIAQVLRHADYAVHFPSLVQHTGELSICNPGALLKKNRISHHYPGADFDAATLREFT